MICAKTSLPWFIGGPRDGRHHGLANAPIRVEIETRSKHELSFTNHTVIAPLVLDVGTALKLEDILAVPVQARNWHEVPLGPSSFGNDRYRRNSGLGIVHRMGRREAVLDPIGRGENGQKCVLTTGATGPRHRHATRITKIVRL